MSNPFLSAWLSTANSWASAARGFGVAEMHRQQTAMMNEFARQVVDFWSGAWLRQFSDAMTMTAKRR